MDIAGKVISIVLVVLVILFVAVFFLKRRSPGLMALYLGFLLLYTVTFILEWVGIKDMEFAQQIMYLVCIVASVIACISFQAEFKSLISKATFFKHRNEKTTVTDDEVRDSLHAIVTACQSMSKSRTGALIVVVQNKIDQYILDSGIRLDALVSSPLLESIFNTKCPMHDGAVIIRDNKILTAGSFLPLTQSRDVDKNLGTRHRAGLGITESEQNDVISIIISEETGIISTCQKGILRRYLTPERLFDILYEPYRQTIAKPSKRKKKTTK